MVNRKACEDISYSSVIIITRLMIHESYSNNGLRRVQDLVVELVTIIVGGGIEDSTPSCCSHVG